MIIARHAESEFNAIFGPTRVDPGIVDPALTERGRAQAADLAERLDGVDLRRVVASPYTRALETASIIAEQYGLPVSADPGIRERRAWVCDIGSPSSELRERWTAIDFPPMAEQWWPEAEESQASIARRSAAYHMRMRADPGHGQTLVISHWGFIRSLTGRELVNGAWLRLDLADTVEVVTASHPC